MIVAPLLRVFTVLPSSFAGPSTMNRPDFTVHRVLEGPTKDLPRNGIGLTHF